MRRGQARVKRESNSEWNFKELCMSLSRPVNRLKVYKWEKVSETCENVLS